MHGRGLVAASSLLLSLPARRPAYAPTRLLNDSDVTRVFMMMDWVAPGLPSLGALAVLCGGGEQACRATLAACGCPPIPASTCVREG